MEKRRIVVGISGATGAIFGIRLLEALRRHPGIETHLIISRWGGQNILTETDYSVEQVAALADCAYQNNELGARISSGSFQAAGMAIVPCSMKTLAAISCGYADTLIARCADVVLKERRPLLLAPRETPLNTIHLENMLRLSRMGVHIVPPMPSFYHRPETIDDLLAHYTGRLLDLLGIESDLATRWDGQL